VGGEEVESGAASGLSYVVGSNDLVDGLDDAIRGKSAGESATFTTTLRNGENAGDEAEVTATVNSVKVKELPELDDDFATLASEFDSIQELRDDLTGRLRQVRTLEQGSQAREKVLEHLLTTVEFPLPESAVQGEVDYREHEIVHQLGHDDAVFDQFLSLQDKTREQFQEELRADAERSVRAQFILDAIADQEQVQVSDAELTEYLVRQAQRYQMPPQEFANQIVQGGNLPLLYADVRRNKALAQVLETAVITDESGNTVDLKALSPQALADVVAGEDEEHEGHDHGHDHADHDHADHDHAHDEH
jgi:trigger factor